MSEVRGFGSTIGASDGAMAMVRAPYQIKRFGCVTGILPQRCGAGKACRKKNGIGDPAKL
ncbi:MAG: hypothetical protein U0075_13590 [Thermomicrobiales bacterium]